MEEDLEIYTKYITNSDYTESEADTSKETIVAENEAKITLPPDHPLLAKFQKSLKDQLEKQIAKISGELTEINIEIKKKSSERDQLGIHVYEAQQLVKSQQESIGTLEEEIKKQAKEREDLELNVKHLTEDYHIKKGHLIKAEEKDLELQSEIESISFLMKQMEDWQTDLHSEVAVNKRMSEKAKRDKIKFAQEKRHIDFIIYKLMTEIFRLETSLEQCDMQLIAKEKEREVLAEMIANSNADQESLEQEIKRIMHSWNCCVVGIKYRDKTYFAAKTELEKVREELTQTLIEISCEKKECNEEMIKNEQLTMIKERLDSDKATLIGKLNYEQNKLAMIENKFDQMQAILNQTIRDLELLIAENKFKKNELNNLRRDIQKQSGEKADIEEKILTLLQEQMSNDKIVKHIDKLIKEKRELNRNMEITVASLENQNANILVNTEKQKAINEDLQRYVDDLTKDKIHKETELNKLLNQVHDDKFKINKLQRKMDLLSKKLEEVIESMGGVEISPEELKIKTLEKLIVEGEEKNKQMQNFWLRQQCYVVELSERRQKQLAEINICRKQKMILEQRNLRLEDELEALHLQERLMEREINNMQIKMDKVYANLAKTKDDKEKLDKETIISRTEFSNELKNMELDCLRLESEIADLESEKTQLGKELIEINREVLIWEKKAQMAAETKKSIEEEKSATGEIGAMQNEIHRMEVRQSQLKKAQDKLVQDLQYCLTRRESIWTRAESTEMRKATGGRPKNRTAIMRKLEDVKNKIKKTENEKKENEFKIKKSYKLEKDMLEDIKKLEDEIENIKKEIEVTEKNIEIGQNNKAKDLEKLVYLQNKARMLRSLEKGSYTTLFKDLDVLEEEYKKEMNRNAKLKVICENLLTDFPQHELKFNKIIHTLRLVFG